MTEALLILAGLVAGALNALAGGGSLVAFPALLAVGVPPVIANASNTFAALPGYAAGAFGYRKDILKYKDRLVLYGAVALVGGYLGAELLLNVSDDAFRVAVPWLMAFAVLAFSFGGRMSKWLTARSIGRSGLVRAGAIGLVILLFLTCVYGGFFNAGLGIILLAVLALGGLDDIHAMNGIKLMISTLVAVVAVARFAVSGSIAWYEGGLVLIGTSIGGYLAARMAHSIPTPLIRALVIVYGAGLSAWFFWDVYLG
jgi:hypothetical protein